MNGMISQGKGIEAVLNAALLVSKYRDPSTCSHLKRVGVLSGMLARAVAPVYKLSDEDIHNIEVFSPYHDIGKIGIPDSILLKSGAFTSEDRSIMNTHTIIGVRMVDELLSSDFDMDSKAVVQLKNMIGFHHERFDGTGYPSGLRSVAIPVEARIVAVADVFDALLSVRPYKEAWEPDKVWKHFHLGVNKHFDPVVTSALFKNFSELVSISQSGVSLSKKELEVELNS